MSLKSKLLSISHPYERVVVDGVSFSVRSLTVAEREWMEKAVRKEVPTESIRAKLFAMCVIDDDYSQVFNPDSDEDVRAILKMPAHVVDEAVSAILRISGLTSDEKEKIAKN